MSSQFAISRCPADRWAEALRVLHQGLPPDSQTGLVQVLQSVGQEPVDSEDEAVFQGLLIATSDDEIVAATWAQLTAGQTAVVWLPDQTSPAANRLFRQLATFLDVQQVTLAQFLVSPNETVSDELIAAGGFEKLADLAYLTVGKNEFPSEVPCSRLTFQPNAAQQSERLGNLLVETYEGSQDCPPLNGVRRPDDVIAGYREQGTFADDRWFYVQRDNLDVGALILTLHADSGNWELVYMGIVPSARGQGLGREVLDFAMWQAGRGGAERLVLAVDQQNQPALDMYQRAGFQPWDHRTVYARLRRKNEADNSAGSKGMKK